MDHPALAMSKVVQYYPFKFFSAGNHGFPGRRERQRVLRELLPPDGGLHGRDGAHQLRRQLHPLLPDVKAVQEDLRRPHGDQP